jgi:hypothetical protein
MKPDPDRRRENAWILAGLVVLALLSVAITYNVCFRSLE